MARSPAKRPIKKRKPRKTFKIITVEAKKPVTNPRFSKLAVGSPDDPFYVNPATIPSGVALQWATASVMNEPADNFPHSLHLKRAIEGGWKPVKGVTVKGLALVWAPIEVAEAQRNKNVFKAREQMREAAELFGLDEWGHRTSSSHLPLVTSSFMVSSNYDSVPPDTEPLDVAVTVSLRLSRRFQDAAAALKLTPEVYAQRRMDLYVRGVLAGLLLPVSASALELFEGGKFELTPRI